MNIVQLGHQLALDLCGNLGDVALGRRKLGAQNRELVVHLGHQCMERDGYRRQNISSLKLTAIKEEEEEEKLDSPCLWAMSE